MQCTLKLHDPIERQGQYQNYRLTMKVNNAPKFREIISSYLETCQDKHSAVVKKVESVIDGEDGSIVDVIIYVEGTLATIGQELEQRSQALKSVATLLGHKAS